MVAAALWCSAPLAQPSANDTDEAAVDDDDAPAEPPPAPPQSPIGVIGDPVAIPDEGGELCISSFMAAQRSRYIGKLIEARQHLIQCANPTCPNALRNQCGPWLNELRPLIPTIIVIAKDLLGRDTSEVRVRVDGELVADKLDGLPIELDPGVHDIEIEHEGRIPIQRRVVLAQGKQDYEVLADFSQMDTGSDETQVPPPQPPAPVPPLAWVGLSVGGAGALVGMTAGIIALERSAGLHDECSSATGCSQREIDEALGFAHASTIGFGIAGLGAVTTVVALLLAWPSAEEPTGAGLSPWTGADVVGVELRF